MFPFSFCWGFCLWISRLPYRNHIGSNNFQSRQLHFVHIFFSSFFLSFFFFNVKHYNNKIPSILWILSGYEAPEQNINILLVYIFVRSVWQWKNDTNTHNHLWGCFVLLLVFWRILKSIRKFLSNYFIYHKYFVYFIRFIINNLKMGEWERCVR